MPGFANLFYLGQPDPAQQLARLLSGQQPQGAPPQGAAPPAGPPPPGGAAAADPNAGPAPNPAPGAPPPPGSSPQPQALQSTPDMSASYSQLANPNLLSLYVQMQQRQDAMQGINQAFAQIAANHAPPSMRAAIMQGVQGGGDAGQMVGNLMSLYQAQTQMGATQSLLAQAPQIAQKLNMDEGIVRSTILAGRGNELIQALEPTPATRDIQAKHDMFIKSAVAQGQDPTAAEATWQRDYLPFIISGGVGGGDSATRSWQTERIRWHQDNPGQPVPWGNDDPQSFALWKAKQDELGKDQTEAANKRPQYVQNLTDLRNGLGDIVGLKPNDSFQFNPDGSLDTSNLDPAKYKLLQSALQKPGAQAYLSGDPRDLTTQGEGALLSPEEKHVLDQIRDVTNPKAVFGSLSGRAPRRSQSDVTTIGSGLEGMTNLRKPPADWLNGVVKTVQATDTATGNAYGASGEAENAPAYAKPYIDSSYLQGGSMYPFGKKPTPMGQDQINFATNQINGASDKEGMRQKLIHLYLADNVDPTPLRNLRF